MDWGEISIWEKEWIITHKVQSNIKVQILLAKSPKAVASTL